jgi:methyl-accepting chemotaxis protein
MKNMKLNQRVLGGFGLLLLLGAAAQAEAGLLRLAGVSGPTTAAWIVAAVNSALGLWIALRVTRSVTLPMTSLLEHVARLRRGELLSRCRELGGDEMGQLAADLNSMADDLKTTSDNERVSRAFAQDEKEGLQTKVDLLLRVVQEVAQGDLTQVVQVKGEDAVGQLGEGVDKLIGDLNQNMTAIAHNAQALAASSEELTSSSQRMAANSEETSAQAATVSEAADQVSRSVQTVATGADEMTASIKEIAKNAQEATRVATSAVRVAEVTSETIAKLGDSSLEIGKVVKVITSIAEQTNLLALNATIEAARAGEAGKGFAVVANEVKELAKATAKATEDISRKIDVIQGDTNQAVKAIKEIRAIIGQINDISTTIASAVEEQTATTNEIGRNVQEAARGTINIAQNITGVAESARSTASGASETQLAAAALSQMAADLQRMVSQFRLEKIGGRAGFNDGEGGPAASRLGGGRSAAAGAAGGLRRINGGARGRTSVG